MGRPMNVYGTSVEYCCSYAQTSVENWSPHLSPISLILMTSSLWSLRVNGQSWLRWSSKGCERPNTKWVGNGQSINFLLALLSQHTTTQDLAYWIQRGTGRSDNGHTRCAKNRTLSIHHIDAIVQGTRGSDDAERPRDAPCQSKSREVLYSCTRNHLACSGSINIS